MDLVCRALGGEMRALARLASLVEDSGATATEIIERIYARTGRAHVVGITGPPGVGKSTLTNKLIGSLRRQDRRVAVVAVDPSSPLSGGATLGDRIRMLDQHADHDVFIRSLAARGHPGGVAAATGGLIHLFDAAGYDPILVETVGVGQSEVDISRLAHTTLVVQSPGTGDDVQAIKAGILEIADIFVVAKADLPGAEQLQRILRTMLEQASDGDSDDNAWCRPVMPVDAISGDGVDALVAQVMAHGDHLRGGEGWEACARRRAWAEIELGVKQRLEKAAEHDPSSTVRELIRSVSQRDMTPSGAARHIIEEGLPSRSD